MKPKKLDNQTKIRVPQGRAKKKFPQGRKLAKAVLFLGSFMFALSSWIYRLFDLGTIIGTGGMSDFLAYLEAIRLALGNQAVWSQGFQAPFGPPFTLIPFMPFVNIPATLSQMIFTLLMILFYIKSWHLVAKTGIKKFSFKNSAWWLGLGIMAWSFPVSYSLGVCNPMGLVTWGVYSYVLSGSIVAGFFLGFASLLKLFPIIPMALWIKQKHMFRKTTLAITTVMLSIAASLMLWPSQWSHYGGYALYLVNKTLTFADGAIQNQSLASMLYRLGLPQTWISNVAVIGSLGLLIGVGYWLFIEKPWKKTTPELRLTWTIRLLAALMLIHPIAWQYYFALFIPYILLQLAQNKYVYLPVLLALSFNGAWLPRTFPGYAFLASSQWTGVLLLLAVELYFKKQSSINQIIKDHNFFNPISVS